MAKAGTAHLFAWKGETLPEYWYYTEQMMTAPCADGCDSLVVDDGDVALLIRNARSTRITMQRWIATGSREHV